MTSPADEPALWPERYLTTGRLVILRGAAQPRGSTWIEWVQHQWLRLRRWAARPNWLAQLGERWLLLPSREQWVLAILLFAFTGGVALLVPLAGVLLHKYGNRLVMPVSAPTPLTPEDSLAAWDTIEARGAGAASRAWLETVSEPAWSSPFLAYSRAAFDGRAEVDQITDLAHRIRNARLTLGARPSGPAAEYWDRQHEALENAAQQLGRRADALIRYRDQTAQLSAELQHLEELERLERSAAEIDGLTIETAYASGRGDGGLGSVAAEIAGVRTAMTELVDLMTRTRAPLAEPPDRSRHASY